MKLTEKIFNIVDVIIFRVVNEEIDFVFRIFEGRGSREKLFKKRRGLFDEDGDDQVRDLLQVVEQHVLLPTVCALKKRLDENYY